MLELDMCIKGGGTQIRFSTRADVISVFILVALVVVHVILDRVQIWRVFGTIENKENNIIFLILNINKLQWLVSSMSSKFYSC